MLMALNANHVEHRLAGSVHPDGFFTAGLEGRYNDFHLEGSI